MGEQQKNNKKKNEFTSPSTARTARKSTLQGVQKTRRAKIPHNAAAYDENNRKRKKEEAEAVQDEATDTSKAELEGSSGSNDLPSIHEEMRQETTTFIVLQKNTSSMNSSERLDELLREVHRVRWDVILISGTWRQGKEVWETQQGHIVVESGMFTNKHGVAILLNRRWRNQINWVQCASERVVAASILVNKQPIILVSAYLPRRGYPDHQVKKTYQTITTAIEKDKSMKIIGGDFNAELGPGEGAELSCVGHYALNKANGRSEWMTQWLLENNLVALNTMYKKLPQKQVTYHTPKGAKKKLDYILTDRKHYCWIKDAEANDRIDMGSDHRCVMAKFEIPKAKRNPSRNKAPPKDLDRVTWEDEHDLKYNDLEQQVNDAEPEKIQKKEAEAKASTTVEAQAVATVAAAASSAAADRQSITKKYAVASEATEAPEAQRERQ